MSTRGAALAVVLVLAVATAEARGDEQGERLQVPAAPVVVSPTLPSHHLFGDRVTAVLEISVNPALADPDSVAVATDFAPYRLVAPPRERREVEGGRLLIRFAFPLQCLEHACLPDQLGDSFAPRPAKVRYVRRGTDESTEVPVSWPAMGVGARVGERDVAVPQFSASAPPASGGSASSLLGWSLAGAAFLVLAGGAVLARHLWTVAPSPPRTGPPEPARTQLEEALRLAERAGAASVDERRSAVDALARSLEEAGRPSLAATARRLAWSDSPPTAAAMKQLVAAGRDDAANVA